MPEPHRREGLSLRITVLIENTASSSALTAEHGLSLYLEYSGIPILLDAGTSGAFASNADALGVDLAGVKTCLLSHGHYDHAGGLAEFFRRNRTAPVYAMRGADRPYYSGDGEKRHEIGIPEEVLAALPGRFRRVENVTELVPGLWLVPHSTPGLERIGAAKKLYRGTETGVLPDDFSHEMSVVLETSRGLVICNSCCHAGLQAVLEEVERQFPGRPIQAFVAGCICGAAGMAARSVPLPPKNCRPWQTVPPPKGWRRCIPAIVRGPWPLTCCAPSWGTVCIR